jgi:hypothetical protein
MLPAMELRKIDVNSIQDNRGLISFSEFEGLDSLFSIKRFYYITQVPEAMSRGNHGHKKLKQLIFALSGNFNLRVTDGENSEDHILSANEKFDADDYIADYEEFLYWRKNESNPIL